VNKKQLIELELAFFDKALKLISDGHFKIKIKGGHRYVVFAPNAAQTRLYRTIRAEIAKGRTCYLMILKPRQIGFSTAIAVLFEALAIVKPSCDIIVAAHNKGARDEIFNIYRRANDMFVEKGGVKQRPTRYDSKNELTFQHNDTAEGASSTIKCSIASEGSIGVSGSFTHAHFSEFALWDDPGSALATALDSLPDNTPGVIVIIETTGKGDNKAVVDPTFREMWDRAEDPDTGWQPKGTLGYMWQPFFFPWFESTENALPVGTALDYTDEERKLVQEFKLTATQIAWRRAKIAARNGDTEHFKTQHPATPDEALGGLALTTFDTESVDAIKKAHCCPCDFRASVLLDDTDGKQILYADPEGPVRIYRNPVPGHRYVMGVDPSMNEGQTPDPAAMLVADLNTHEIVAVYEDDIDPDALAFDIVALAKRYNNATVGIERTGPGAITIKRMTDLGYTRIYSHAHLIRIGMRIDKELGVSTASKQMKLKVLSAGARIVKNRDVIIYDSALLHQLRIVRKDRRGKIQAPKGEHDDLAIAFSVMSFVASEQFRWSPHSRSATPEREHKPTDDYTQEELRITLARKREQQRRELAPLFWSV
jgi:hypothetical protein